MRYQTPPVHVELSQSPVCGALCRTNLLFVAMAAEQSQLYELPESLWLCEV